MRTLMLRILAAAVVVGLAAGLSYGQASVGAGRPKSEKAKPRIGLTYVTLRPDGHTVEMTLREDGRLELIERRDEVRRHALAWLDADAQAAVAEAAVATLAVPILGRPSGRRAPPGFVTFSIAGRPAHRTLGAASAAERELQRVLDEIADVVREGVLDDLDGPDDQADAAAATAAPILPVLPRRRMAG